MTTIAELRRAIVVLVEVAVREWRAADRMPQDEDAAKAALAAAWGAIEP